MNEPWKFWESYFMFIKIDMNSLNRTNNVAVVLMTDIARVRYVFENGDILLHEFHALLSPWKAHTHPEIHKEAEMREITKT